MFHADLDDANTALIRLILIILLIMVTILGSTLHLNIRNKCEPVYSLHTVYYASHIAPFATLKSLISSTKRSFPSYFQSTTICTTSQKYTALKRNYESGYHEDGARSVLSNLIKKSRGLLRRDSHIDTGCEENEVLKSIITSQKASLCPLYKILDKENGTLIIKYLYSLIENEDKTFGFISRGDANLIVSSFKRERLTPPNFKQEDPQAPRNELPKSQNNELSQCQNVPVVESREPPLNQCVLLQEPLVKDSLSNTESLLNESTASTESLETRDNAQLRTTLVSNLQIFTSDSVKFSNYAIVLRGTIEDERKDLILNKKRIRWFLRSCGEKRQRYTSVLNAFMNARPTHSFEDTENISFLLINPIILPHDIVISRYFLILDN